MRMRKIAALFLIFLLFAAAALGLAACSGTELESGYSDVVEEFYGDGMTYLASHAAPANATQYKDMPRVDKKLVVDNRISGSHITGLYLPAGESVRVVIPSETVTYMSAVAVLSPDGSVSERQTLVRGETVITSQTGGILLYYIGEYSVGDDLAPFEIYFYGAMPAPYYRYGLDSSDDLGDLTRFGDMLVTLDCGNMRFYVPASEISPETDLKSALKWWRSATGVIADALSAGRTDGNSAPVKVYYTANVNEETDILLSASDFDGLFSASRLATTSSGLALLKKTGEFLAGERGDGGLSGKLAAFNAYMLLKDSFVIYDESSTEEKDELYFSNAYAVLQKIISGTSTDKTTDVALCLMHSGGTAAASRFIDELEGADADALALSAAQTLELNACAFISAELGEEVSPEVAGAAADKKEYVPVFNYYTRSALDQNEQNGYKVYAGDTHKVDFAAMCAVYDGEVLSVELSGSNGWEKREDGYYYTALSENVRDAYTLTIKARSGGKEIEYVSYGDISLNVNAASYALYEELPIDGLEGGTVTQEAIDKAVDIYADHEPTYSRSLALATCGVGAYEGGEIADSQYTFSVTSFNFEVEEDGVYNFSVINEDTGFCYYRVDFGVGDYEYTMFQNYVPVQNLGLLSRTEELKKGYVYRFDIFVLQPGISNGLTLYVSKDGGDYLPVGAEYMSYPGTSKAEQMEYTAPELSLQGTVYPDTLYMKADASAWTGMVGEGVVVRSGEADAPFDGSTGITSVYELYVPSKGAYTVNFDKKLALDYVRIYASATGVTYALSVYDGNWHQVARGLTGSETVRVQGEYSALRLDISGNGTIELREVEAGTYIDNCTFVPHTSGDIWFEGNWSRMTGGVSVNGSVAQNTGDNAYAEYTFYGDEVAILATKGARYGSGIVYIDGKRYAEVSLSSESTIYQTVAFYAKLDEVGSHTIRFESDGGDVINIDALAYSEGVYDPDDTSMPFNPYYLFILLGIVVAGVIVCAILDHRTKHKKKKRFVESDGRSTVGEKADEPEAQSADGGKTDAPNEQSADGKKAEE